MTFESTKSDERETFELVRTNEPAMAALSFARADAFDENKIKGEKTSRMSFTKPVTTGALACEDKRLNCATASLVSHCKTGSYGARSYAKKILFTGFRTYLVPFWLSNVSSTPPRRATLLYGRNW